MKDQPCPIALANIQKLFARIQTRAAEEHPLDSLEAQIAYSQNLSDEIIIRILLRSLRRDLGLPGLVESVVVRPLEEEDMAFRRQEHAARLRQLQAGLDEILNRPPPAASV